MIVRINGFAAAMLALAVAFIGCAHVACEAIDYAKQTHQSAQQQAAEPADDSEEGQPVEWIKRGDLT